jgi:L-iditol 2-dehydrogenase
VVKVGNKVNAVSPGDRVVGECVIGDDHFGFSISGAAAEFFVARPDWLHRLPDELSWTMGALVEPFSVAYYAITRAGGVDASDLVVVLGAGPIGLAVIAAAHAMGARVIAVEPSPERRTAASSVGTDRVVDPANAVDLLAELSNGRGADLVVEATGRPVVMAQALELVCFQGRIAYIGIDVGQEAPAKLGLIQSKELRITRSIGSPGVWPETLRFLAASGIDLSSIVTEHFDVDGAVDALETAHHPSPSTIKAHIEFTGSL